MISPRTLFVLSAVMVSFIMLLLSALRIARPQDWRGYTFSLQQRDIGDEQVTSEKSETNNYVYPFPTPGILPDNPFYWLKMIRDRMRLWATFDDYQEFRLLWHYADKRLKAGEILVKKGNFALGVSTITKAEKYLHLASQYVPQLQSQLTEEEQELLRQAFISHHFVMESLVPLVADNQQAILQASIELNRTTLKTMISH